jgi:DNA-binding transcriptional LysR family regulator
VLSRQIRKLEQELGAELFARSSRHVELTEAGRQLLDEARPLLAAADAASRRVKRAAQGQGSLTLGFYIGDPLRRVVKALHSAHPEVTVEVVRIYWFDQPAALLDGRLDLAFVHLPIDDGGLTLLRICSSPRLVLLPASHPLAGRDEIWLTDIAEDPVVLHRGASPAWEAWHNTDPRPDGRRPRPGPFVGNLEEQLEVIAMGRAISFVPTSVAAAIQMPPDVAAIRAADLPPTEICLAWRAERESSAIAAFVEVAQGVFSDSAQAVL